eukprot:gnl/Trimastix_PCT/949.p1 GENE.gnl/Trimastix_PCT/949~~gnl/Trimastix_PCT/949.p1  ORF type:complete len:927 (-),score=211.80 gnl/Trimastix_PCT/949:400-3180(-)
MLASQNRHQFGKRLHINLTTGSIEVQEIPQNVLDKYVGGVGLGTYYFCNEVAPRTNPLGPDNSIYFCSGPLQGSDYIMQGRYALVTKSPLSGLYMDSHSGGFVGPEMKFCGYDMVSLTGRSATPVYILITNEGVQIKPANAIWGRNIHETENYLRQQHNENVRCLTIGAGGEKCIPYACVINDGHHAMGRGGAGAVLGSKQIKAVAFYSSVHNETKVDATLQQAKQELLAGINRARQAGNPMFSMGTSGAVMGANHNDQYPTRNQSAGYFEHFENLTGQKILETYKTESGWCYNCAVGCTHFIRGRKRQELMNAATSPLPDLEDYVPNRGLVVPQYETLGMMGGNLGITNVEYVVRLNRLADDLGLDTISTGASLACLAEMKQRNLLPVSLLPYLPTLPEFGEAQKFIDLLPDIVNQTTPVGKFLALGPNGMVKYCYDPVAAADCAQTVKGLPQPAWDGRGRMLVGLAYATAPIGATHLEGMPASPIPPEAFDPANPVHTGIFDSLLMSQDCKQVMDSLIFCAYAEVGGHLSLEKYAMYLSHLGNSRKTWSAEDVRNLGRRIWRLQHCFNVRELDAQGIVPASMNTVAKRMLTEALPTGSAKGCRAFTSEAEFVQLRTKFFAIRGFDAQGRPTAATVREMMEDSAGLDPGCRVLARLQGANVNVPMGGQYMLPAPVLPGMPIGPVASAPTPAPTPAPAPAPAPVEEEEDIFAAARSICNQRATPASAAPMHSPPQDRKRGRSPPPRRGEDWDRRGDRRGDRRDDRRDEHREDSRRDEHREERRGDRRDEHRVDRRGDRRDERREDRRGDRHDRRRHHRHRSHRSRSRPSSPRRHSPRSPHARSSRSAERSLRSSRPRSRSPEASAPTSATSIQARLSMLKAKYGEQNASAGPAQARNAPSLSQPNTSTVVLRTNRVTSKFYRTMAQ